MTYISSLQSYSSLTPAASNASGPTIGVFRGHTLIQLPLADITCVEAAGNYSILYMASGQKVVLSKTLKVVEEQVGSSFIRVHKSYLVNRRFVDFMDHTSRKVYLHTGDSYPISRRKYNEVAMFLVG